MVRSLSIKNWSLDDRPREKLLEKGARALSNAELLAIILSSGTKEESAVDLAKRILNTINNSIDKLSELSVNELCKYKGVGKAKAITIIAAFELSRRKINVNEKVTIKNSSDAYEYLNQLIGNIEVEEFWVVLLNNSARVISSKKNKSRRFYSNSC